MNSKWFVVRAYIVTSFLGLLFVCAVHLHVLVDVVHTLVETLLQPIGGVVLQAISTTVFDALSIPVLQTASCHVRLDDHLVVVSWARFNTYLLVCAVLDVELRAIVLIWELFAVLEQYIILHSFRSAVVVQVRVVAVLDA